MAAVVVTAVTVAVIGVLLMASTPLGCGPAKALHMKAPSRCETVASTSPNAFPPFRTPSPSAGTPNPQPSFNPNPQPTFNPNPYPEPGSPGIPVQRPASGAGPYPDSTSGGFPPFGNPASGPVSPGLALNCRLPVYAGGPGSGGFISFPGGNFIADPRSAVAAPSPSPGAPSPTPQQGPGPGQYPGWWGLAYDRQFSRWLPVPYRWVSPDGAHWAYPGTPDGIYVQDVASGTQVELGADKSWRIIDVAAGAVYAVTGTSGGLWVLAFGGAVTQVTNTGYWQAVGGGFAYGSPTSSVPQGVGNTILQANLANGSMVGYFGLQGLQSNVQGFDPTGNPIIYVSGQGPLQIWIGTSPGHGTQIADFGGANFYPNGLPIADSRGIWLASYNGIALHISGNGWYPMSNIGGTLAGGCY